MDLNYYRNEEVKSRVDTEFNAMKYMYNMLIIIII